MLQLRLRLSRLHRGMPQLRQQGLLQCLSRLLQMLQLRLRPSDLHRGMRVSARIAACVRQQGLLQCHRRLLQMLQLRLRPSRLHP